MIDKHITVDEIRWRRVLPWLNLLRIPDISFRVRAIVAATIAVLVFGLGNTAFRQLPFVVAKDSDALFPVLTDLSRAVSENFWAASGLTNDSDALAGRWLSPRRNEPENRHQARESQVGYGWMVWPLETVFRPARRLFDFGNTWSEVATAWTALLWALLVWGIFGGASCRMMAIRFTQDQSVPLRTALRFSVRNWHSYLYGPLLPLLGVGVLTLIASSVGCLERWLVTSNGTVLAVFGFIPTLCAVVMTFLLALTAMGWPLMTAAISTEGSDGFDGLSRAFGYVLNRFWSLLGLTCLTLIVGYFMSDLMLLFFQSVHWLIDWSVGPTSEIDSGTLWLDILGIVQRGVSVSFFWSAVTVIYFLLRQSEDGTPLDQVYISDPLPKAESLPVVGVAASQQQVIEQPLIERRHSESSGTE